MSMFIEAWSSDFAVHGDGASTTATVNLVGWPINLDLSEAGEFKVAAMLVSEDAEGNETLTQITSELDNPFVKITFPTVLQGGEHATVRLRAKVLV